MEIQNLREQVNLHLSTIITGMLSQARAGVTGNYGFGKLTAAIPDVRVSVNGGVSVTHEGAPLHMMIISVENHSPMTVYISRVVVDLDRDEELFIKTDLLTGIFNGRRELNPGQCLDFHILPDQLRKFRDRTFGCAVAIDEIRRRYRSPEDGAVQRLVGSLLKDLDEVDV
jgi:hypothetical protein